MGIESTKRPFSKRHGYCSRPKEITIWEDAPENLRHFVLETITHGLRAVSDPLPNLFSPPRET